MNGNDVAHLHDATLHTVALDWSTGEVIIELSTDTARVCLRATEATLVRCPRQMPWGTSASVNAMRVIELTERSTRLEMELQSGDVIEIEASNVSLKTTPSRPS